MLAPGLSGDVIERCLDAAGRVRARDYLTHDIAPSRPASISVLRTTAAHGERSFARHPPLTGAGLQATCTVS